MKRILCILVAGIICLSNYSCIGETCTSTYGLALKIDGKKNDRVFIRYIGPEKRNYREEFGFNKTEYKSPYFYNFMVNTICKTNDFKNHNYDFLEFKNLGAEDIYICAVLDGREVERIPHYVYYVKLLEIYDKQDQDPNYDYTKDKSFEGVQLDYMDRYDFYERLLKESYPYIIKLAPQQGCVMKWGGLGIKAL